MKVIIAGSRHMEMGSFDLIQEAVNASGFQVDEVVCGMANGADILGMYWAKQKGIPVAKFPADWKQYGKAAGPIRNKQMLDYADGLIVFIWNGSRGSENMLRQTKKAGKPYYVVRNGEIDEFPKDTD